MKITKTHAGQPFHIENSTHGVNINVVLILWSDNVAI